MYEVNTRDVPIRSVLCLKRNVVGEQEAWALGKEFVGVLRRHQLPRIPGSAGAWFCIYWAEVSEDSDGPIEWCHPVPADNAEALAKCHELTLRVEPAHREAFIKLGRYGQVEAAQWPLISQSLQAWVVEHGARPDELGVRITYDASAPRSEPNGPDCDFALPISPRSA